MSVENSAYLEPSSLGDLFVAANRIASDPTLIDSFVDAHDGIREQEIAAYEGGFFDLPKQDQNQEAFVKAAVLGREQLRDADMQPPAQRRTWLVALFDLAERQHERWLGSAPGQIYLEQQYADGALVEHPLGK